VSFVPLRSSHAVYVVVHLMHTTSQQFALLPSNKLNIGLVHILSRDTLTKDGLWNGDRIHSTVSYTLQLTATLILVSTFTSSLPLLNLGLDSVEKTLLHAGTQ
jgi:hypothetical protein